MTEKGGKLTAKGTALHRQLYVLLKEQITSGRYGFGDLLPTQEVLCREFSISRITVRRALNDLVEEGFVRNRQGVGAFVAVDIGKARQGPDFSFIGDMRRTLKETTMQILLLETARCPRATGAHLGLADDEPALHLVRTRSIAGKPVTLLDGWIPLRFAKAVTALNLQTKSLHELIAGSFEQLGGVAQEVNAALAGPRVAQALDIEINSPTLKIDRLVHNRGGAPVHYLTVWTTPLRTRLVMEVGADDIDGYNVGRLLHDVQR
ncbi:MAG: GntR family transcriptional regulator [Enhydrobacter sp.]|nr:GntR family transcriptional regulator [Enhydrobacter sp.]